MDKLAAAGSALGGAAQLGSLFFSNNQAAQTQADIASANMAQAAQAQRYQAQLNALAMQRAIAGITDAQGNKVSYDPATNTWRTVLSPRGTSLQNAADNATLTRNTSDLNRAERSNNASELRSVLAERLANSARMRLENFTPTDSRALEGALQEGSTLANRESFRPVIDSTLRQFARTGTAAGPVLGNIAARNATELRKSMLDNIIRARTGTIDMNNAIRTGALQDYAGTSQIANPNYTYPAISGDSPVANLVNALNSRASNAANTAGIASYGVPGMTNAFSSASKLGIESVPNSNLMAARLTALGQGIPTFYNSIRDLFGGGSNAGDGGQWDL